MEINLPELSLTNILVFVSFFFALNRIFKWKSKIWKWLMKLVYAVSFGVTVYRLAAMFGL